MLSWIHQLKKLKTQTYLHLSRCIIPLI